MRDRRNGGASLDGVLVGPGEMAMVTDGTTLVSIVGSGVAVCLWARDLRIGALAHFVEPSIRDRSRATARFGNVAVPEIVRMVRHSGALDIEAQLFGSASVDGEDSKGKSNLEVALRVLSRRKIPVVSRDVGGSKGRKVVFDGGSGQVAVVKVHRLRQEDWNA